MARRPTSSRSPTDWTDAALDALAAGGIGAVRVEAIARSIGVTKGSFYWHFADRPALVAAMLHTWQTRVLDELSAVDPTGPVRAQVAQLLTAIGTSAWRDHELGLRHHARFDEDAAGVVARVDVARRSRLAALFGFVGCDEAESQRRSRIALAALAGAAPSADMAVLVDDLTDVLANTAKAARGPDGPAETKKKNQLSLF